MGGVTGGDRNTTKGRGMSAAIGVCVGAHGTPYILFSRMIFLQ